MDNYASKYEEYKNTLSHSTWFRRELNNKYSTTLDVEKAYIEGNGVLWKVGVLSGVCGFCLLLVGLMEDRSDTKSIVMRIILWLIMIAVFAVAMHIGNKFKKNLGERVFYTFLYHQHFKDHVKKEKDKETEKLLDDMLSHYEALLWRSDSIPNMPKEDLESLLFGHLQKVGDYQKRYKELNRYDGFASDLKYDYDFNSEIIKNIEKYF